MESNIKNSKLELNELIQKRLAELGGSPTKLKNLAESSLSTTAFNDLKSGKQKSSRSSISTLYELAQILNLPPYIIFAAALNVSFEELGITLNSDEQKPTLLQQEIIKETQDTRKLIFQWKRLNHVQQKNLLIIAKALADALADTTEIVEPPEMSLNKLNDIVNKRT